MIEALWMAAHRAAWFPSWWCFQAAAVAVGALVLARAHRASRARLLGAYAVGVVTAALGAVLVANGADWAAWLARLAHGAAGPPPPLEVAGFGALAGLVAGFLLATRTRDGATQAREDALPAREGAPQAREGAHEHAPRAREDAPHAREDAPRAREDAPRAREDAPRAHEDAARALACAVGPMLAVARLGCFFAGCDFGKPASLPWALSYPHWTPAFATQLDAGLIDAASPLTRPVHPTQLYEVALGVALFFLARSRRANRLASAFTTRPVPALPLVVAAYAAGRFALDFLRGDEPRGALGLTTAQLIAVAVLALLIAWRSFQTAAPERINAPTRAASKDQ